VYLARIHRLRAEARLKRSAATAAVQERFAAQRAELRQRHQSERQQLKDKQSRLYVRIIAFLDFTGITRRRQQAARSALAKEHTAVRKEFSRRYHQARAEADRALKERYAKSVADERTKRHTHLAQLKDRHKQMDGFADIERQQRELDREHTRKLTDKKLEEFKREQGEKETGKTSGSFADAIRKVANQEKNRNDKDRGPDRGYER
jgi:hypothetical protein